MTKWERVKCAIGLHGDLENTGAGVGSVLIQGHQLATSCRVWQCVRCGKEFGRVTCPRIPGWGPESVPPEFVRKTSRYRDFDTANVSLDGRRERTV